MDPRASLDLFEEDKVLSLLPGIELRVPTAPSGPRTLILDVSRSHTTTHHSLQHSSGRVINPSQRPLPDNTQNSQQTNIHATGGIRTHNLSKRGATDPRLRPRGHQDRLVLLTFRNRASYIQDGHTATLQTPHFIYFSKNIRTEFFKHTAHSTFFPLQNAVYFIMLPFLVPV